MTLREKALHFADELEAGRFISLTPEFLRAVAAALSEQPASD